MSNIQSDARAAFKASPELYPIVNGIVREQDEDTLEINLNLLAIDLFRSRTDTWCTTLKMYIEEVKEAFNYYIDELADDAVEFFIATYTGEASTPNKDLLTEFGDYVRDWIKNNGDGDELTDIAHNFVRYDNGKILITNASKLVQI